MAIVRKKRSKSEYSFLVRVKDLNGQWYESKTFRSKSEAENYERELEDRKYNSVLAVSPELKKVSVDEYFKVWSAECRLNVSDGWQKKQQQKYRDYISPSLGALKLTDVTIVHVGRLMSVLSKKKLSPQMILHIYNLLHKMYSDAVDYFGVLNSNPVLKKFRPKVPLKERDFLSPQESLQLLSFAKGDIIEPLIYIQLYASLRPSEAIGLRVGSINFDTDTILIKEIFNKSERKLQAFPKQKDWGKAPIPPVLKVFLENYCSTKSKESFLVETQKDVHISYEYYYERLKKLSNKAGLKTITPHELRHSSTEIYLNAGATVEDIRRLLNHKSLSCAARYIHRTDTRLQSIASSIK
jgi:integrase